MSRLFAFALLCLVCTVTAATASAAQRPTGYWVTPRAVSANLENRYDSAFCSGLRKYGTASLRTSEYSWDAGFWRFECSYHTPSASCYGGQFETDTGAKARQWYVRMLAPGRCYSI
jgi:hypothetical protein